jgi:hypothetical protein
MVGEKELVVHYNKCMLVSIFGLGGLWVGEVVGSHIQMIQIMFKG